MTAKAPRSKVKEQKVEGLGWGNFHLIILLYLLPLVYLCLRTFGFGWNFLCHLKMDDRKGAKKQSEEAKG